MAGQNTSILSLDYNNLQSLVSSILGTGSANAVFDPTDPSDYGYGQPVSSSTILPGNTITTTHWNNLRADILKCRQHQTGLNEGLSILPVTNAIVITESYRASLNAMLTTASADVNRLITPPDGSAPNTFAQGTRTDLIPAQQRTTLWNNTITQTVTVTFPSPNAARYFFNTGSQIEINASRTGGTTSGTMGSKNTSWTNLLSGMGTIVFSAHATNRSGSSGTAQTQVGWYEVGTTDREIFQQQDPTPGNQYSTNRYIIKAKTNAQRSQLIFTIEFRDAVTGQVDDNVDGTLTSRVQMYYAIGSNVSVTPPTATSTPLTLGGNPIITTYSIVPSATLINTGTPVTFTVTTFNVASGTILYWENIGTTIASNFTDNTNTGTVTVDADNIVTFTRTLKNDFSVEPSTNIVMKLSTTQGGSAVATASPVAIRPPTPPPPTPPPPTPPPPTPAPVPSGELYFTTYATSARSWTVPAGVNAIYFDVRGAGGGGGGPDSKAGGAGSTGYWVTGKLAVSPGNTIALHVGEGGKGGITGGGVSVAGGRSTAGYAGGGGGASGPSDYSGSGGGGGAASVLAKNGVAIVIAGGGGGGGGGGDNSAGTAGVTSNYSTITGNGINGQDRQYYGIGDGGGGGGGGGGDKSGKGGDAVNADDYGGTGGSRGDSKAVNTLGYELKGAHANSAGAAGKAGGNGTIYISWGPTVNV